LEERRSFKSTVQGSSPCTPKKKEKTHKLQKRGC